MVRQLLPNTNGMPQCAAVLYSKFGGGDEGEYGTHRYMLAVQPSVLMAQLFGLMRENTAHTGTCSCTSPVRGLSPVHLHRYSVFLLTEFEVNATTNMVLRVQAIPIATNNLFKNISFPLYSSPKIVTYATHLDSFVQLHINLYSHLNKLWNVWRQIYFH
jgi:hypothetical protein